MELRHLRYFVAVAEQLSVAGAAKRLRLAQPALSRQIQDLELEVGTSLFHRVPRGVRLTPAGEAFLEDAREALRSAARARERALKAAQLDAETLRIAHGELYAYDGAIQQLLSAFREANPAVRIELHGKSDAETERGLRDRHIDVGFGFVLQWPLDGLAGHRLFDSSATGVLLPARHPLSAQSAIRLAQLRNLRWLGVAPGSWPGMVEGLDAAFRSRGLVAVGGPERSRASPLINVAAEDAWSLASELVGAPYRGDAGPVVCRPLVDAPIAAWLAMVWPPEASTLVQCLRNVAVALGMSAGDPRAEAIAS